MSFFKKIGRPTQEEEMMLNVILQSVEEKNIPLDEIPHCFNLDDLIEAAEFVETYQRGASTKSSNVRSDTDLVDDNSNIDTIESEPDTEVAEISETDQQQSAEEYEEIPALANSESVLSESGIDASEILGNEPVSFVDSNYDPFDEPIIERSYTKTAAEGGHDEPEPLPADPDLEESKDSPLDDLNPNTKRRAAEQTAEALLQGYCKLAPEPFKWWCKFPKSKIEKMAFSGELDLSIEVGEGLSFEDYMNQTNEQIDEIFEVQEETKEEIREPLIEVLMEQELELTPQQRLGMAVVSHLIQMFTLSMKLWSQNKRILEYQKHLTTMMNQSAKAA